MIAHLEVVFGRFAPAPDLHVRRFISAIRNLVIKKIGQTELDVTKLLEKLGETCLVRVQALAKRLHGVEQRLGIFTLCLRLANGLRARVSFIAQGFSLDL